MISNPYFIIFFLLFIESLILFLADHSRTKKYFSFLPSVFWIYFLPMLASTAGVLDSESWVYGVITAYLLPASLFLLLIPVDIRAIARLGKKAVLMFLAGSCGSMIGTVISCAIFAPVVGREFWSGFGALSASWIGGSANMVAVKEAIRVPDAIFLPMVVVDTIVPYVWMGLLVTGVAWQARFDRWVRADQTILDNLKARLANLHQAEKKSLRFLPALALILLALVGGGAAREIAKFIPEIPNMFAFSAWTIILASGLGILLSFTPARKLENIGASKVGYFLLYLVLTSIGAKANIANLGSAVVLIAAGFLILAIHALVLIVAARLLRAPMLLTATASQANIGGVASAPVVAEIYQTGFASVGLLMAILGNIIGTYLGILVAQLCRLIVGI